MKGNIYLILEARKVGIMTIVHLPFMIDDCEQIVLIHGLWARRSGKPIFGKQKETTRRDGKC